MMNFAIYDPTSLYCQHQHLLEYSPSRVAVDCHHADPCFGPHALAGGCRCSSREQSARPASGDHSASRTVLYAPAHGGICGCTYQQHSQDTNTTDHHRCLHRDARSELCPQQYHGVISRLRNKNAPALLRAGVSHTIKHHLPRVLKVFQIVFFSTGLSSGM